MKSKKSNKKNQINEKLVKSPFTFQNVNNGSKGFTQDHGSIMGKASDDGWFNIMAFTFNHLQKFRRKKNVKWARIKNKIKFPTKILSQFQIFLIDVLFLGWESKSLH